MQNLNMIFFGDNLPILKKMLIEMAGKVHLAYIDPPLATGSDYKDVGDNLGSANELMKMLRPRIIVIRELLAENGSFFFHSDWRIASYFQIFLDEIFGRQNMIAKIIWQRSNRASSFQRFIPHTYDVILFYGKSSHVRCFPQYMPYSDNEIEVQYKYQDEETGKRYRLVNITSPNVSSPIFTYEFLGVRRNWRFTKEKMEEEYKQGRIIQKKPGAVPMLRQYANEGKLIGDIWTDINVLSVANKEKTGYPTQKPLALMQRIIQISTDIDDIILDPFCGSGTTLVAAETLGRKWIGVDISPTACDIASERIASLHQGASASEVLLFQDKRTFKEIGNLPAYEFENWVISVLKKVLKDDPKYAKLKDLEIQSEAEVYSITSGSQLDLGFDFTIRSIPVMIKQKEKIEAKEITNFAIQLRHHKQDEGIYVALSFLKSAQEEVKKEQKEGIRIILISAKELLRK